MADTTYSVKVSEEMQEKIRQLIEESGSSSKDFFSNMVAQYELELTKTHTPILSNDITEIQQLTKRIDNIFIGIGERIGTLQADHSRDMEERAASSNDTIQLLQQRINTLEQDKTIDGERIQNFIYDKEQAELKAHELSQKVKQLEDMNIKNDTIISEYKQKIDDLSSIVSEYKTAYEDNKGLRQELMSLQQDSKAKVQEISTLTATIEDMKAVYNKTANDHITELETAKEHITDKLSIAHDKAMLKLENDCRLKLDEQQTRHNEKLNKYEDKVQQLLHDIEMLSNTKTTKKSTAKPL